MARPIHLSATAIREFLHCPRCFKYAYIDGLRPVLDTESQRMGTNWHKLHEIYRIHAALPEHENAGRSAFDTAIDHLNTSYATVPNSITAEEWELERIILAMSFAGYVWYYQNDKIEVLATEVGFKLPIRNPKTGLPLPMTDVLVPGKIDEIIRRNGVVSISDYKSTTKSLDPDSDFWAKLRRDPQLSTYVMGLLDLQKAGGLEQYGISKDTEINGAFYDVWHKPQIVPKMVPQGETDVFINDEKHTYFGQEFQVEVHRSAEGVVTNFLVNGKQVAFETGKTKDVPNKKVSVRETAEMFGARLLADIYERPGFYFVRKEIPRTADDIKMFRREVFGIYQNIKFMRDNDAWYSNDLQDAIASHGSWGTLCYRNVDVSDGHTPEGFKRIFGEEKVA